MWRFFRLGIKSGTCPGNQAHFRIIGTTCANAECDDKGDEANSCTLDGEHRSDTYNKENFASRAAKKFQKYLQYQESFPLKNTQNYDIKFGYFGESASNSKQNFINKDEFGNFKGVSIDFLQNEISEYRNINTFDTNPEYNDDDFGSLIKQNRDFELHPDDVDAEKEIYEPRLSAHKYGRKILQLCKERKLKEALDVLEVEMKAVDIVPDHYCYNILINACGKMGYTKKAFDLYYKMKQRGLKPQKFAYTGLFNACANSPFKNTEGLELAKALRKHLKDHQIILHPITYNAMIKAFGHCGDIKTAFEIVDEMINDGHDVKTETMNFVIHACISDKKNGFRHALMVWRKMRSLLIVPDIYSYNLLLRCVKECGAGDHRLFDEIFEEAKENQKLKGRLKKIREGKIKSLKIISQASMPKDNIIPETLAKPDRHNGICNKENKLDVEKISFQVNNKAEVVKVNLTENMEMEIVNSLTKIKESSDSLPNLLLYYIHPGSIVSITSLDKRDERLCLLGGIPGILESMKQDRVRPTAATFTLILESLPGEKDVEEMLLTTMAKCSVLPDVIFLNKLIHKRCLRKKFTEATDILELMQEHHIPMDLITFSTLALGCRKPSEISRFLKDVDKAGLTPSMEIMGLLIFNSLKSQEYVYTIKLLQKLKFYGIKPSERILETLEHYRTIIKEKMIKQEVEKNVELTPWEKRKREEMRVFLMEYKYWLKKSQVEFKDHPWAQFGYQEKVKAASKQKVT